MVDPDILKMFDQYLYIWILFNRYFQKKPTSLRFSSLLNATNPFSDSRFSSLGSFIGKCLASTLTWRIYTYSFTTQSSSSAFLNPRPTRNISRLEWERSVFQLSGKSLRGPLTLKNIGPGFVLCRQSSAPWCVHHMEQSFIWSFHRWQAAEQTDKRRRRILTLPHRDCDNPNQVRTLLGLSRTTPIY